jgi:hypothetical protein
MYELTDLEKSKVFQFMQDENMVEAVRKVMLASMYSNGTLRQDADANPLTNAAFALVALASSGQGTISNADLGEDLRGLYNGVQLMERGFKRLSEVKLESEPVETPYNEAI